MEQQKIWAEWRWRNDLLTQLVSLLGSNKSSRSYCEPEHIERREAYELQARSKGRVQRIWRRIYITT